MNVYDFDGTIYNGDSSVDYYLFLLSKKPILIKYIFVQSYGFFLYWLNLISKTKLKEYYFSFMKDEDSFRLLDEFWMAKEKKIYKWYLTQKNSNDVIISASPEFLLSPICKKLNVKHLIASEVDVRSGSFLSANCYGEEKVKRFQERFGNIEIEEFYSDSKTDFPMTLISKKSFFVMSGRPEAWK